MVETLCSRKHVVGAKVFILFLSKIAPLSLIDVAFSFVAMLMFALLQILGNFQLFNKVIEFDIG